MCLLSKYSLLLAYTHAFWRVKFYTRVFEKRVNYDIFVEVHGYDISDLDPARWKSSQ